MQSIFLLYSGCETKSPAFFPWYSSNHQSGPHCPITVAERIPIIKNKMENSEIKLIYSFTD